MNHKHLSLEEIYSISYPNRHEFKRCKNTYKGSGLYIIQFETGIKIGVSRNLKSRLSFYKAPWTQQMKEIICYQCPNPTRLEHMLKKYFKQYTTENSTEYFVGLPMEILIKFLEERQLYKSTEYPVTH